MSNGLRRVRLTAVPPSDRAWEAETMAGQVTVVGLPAGKYSARWWDAAGRQRFSDWVFDVPTTGPVSPPRR